MPALTPSADSTILVTGANGYLASWVLHSLLTTGYTVRAAVRSLAKAKPLEEHFSEYSKNGRLSFVIVEDILKDGAFDEAVKGVDGVLHLASPAVNPAVTDPQETIAPAVQGTLSLLRSASLPGSTVKRIVMTSSVLAILALTPGASGPDHVFTENDWSDAPRLVENGVNSPLVVYCASKALAEKAAWDFIKEKGGKEALGWDYVALNPPFMFGPPIHGASDPKTWPTTQAMWYGKVLKEGLTKEELSESGLWIDVRDIAAVHVLALEKEAAAGERIYVGAGNFVYQEWLDLVNKVAEGTNFRVNKGFPEVEKVYKNKVSSEKEEKIFGYQFRTKEGTTKDIIAPLIKAAA